MAIEDTWPWELQSLATKNDMQFGVLESRFKACNGLRIQRYGKKTQTVRFACTHCGCCTGEIQARKVDGHGGTELSDPMTILFSFGVGFLSSATRTLSSATRRLWQ